MNSGDAILNLVVRDALKKLRNSRVREHARGQASKLARSRITESSGPPVIMVSSFPKKPTARKSQTESPKKHGLTLLDLLERCRPEGIAPGSG